MKRKKTTSLYRSYSELVKIDSFDERIDYLRTSQIIGDQTFGGHRLLNQRLYESYEWKKVRNQAILRDDGFDLAHEYFPIKGQVYVHHINPITIEDLLQNNPIVFDLENLICCSMQTHNEIHYGRQHERETRLWKPRQSNDTCLWR